MSESAVLVERFIARERFLAKYRHLIVPLLYTPAQIAMLNNQLLQERWT